MSYLLDTNVICELIKDKPNQNVIDWFNLIPEEALYLSVITIGEIRKGIEKLTEKIKKEKYRIWLEHAVLERFGERILVIDIQIAERWGRLLGETPRSIPAIDSLIGATALHHDLAIVTRNTKDYPFAKLEIINPWQ